MIEIKKAILNNYIDLSENVRDESKITTPYNDPKDKNWGAKILVYDTLKYIEKLYFDFKNYKFNIQDIYKGNVLEIIHEREICSSTSNLFHEYYLIIDKSDLIIMQKYESLAKAVKAQRKNAKSYNFTPITNRSK
ncbi:hypothetical protein HNP37_004472 [Flavobacterium nitrogenifigens]|uniref:Uncharacterized protein n=2 Tax=Flavobacterium TaxID=237 RepID=A0A7W7J1K7_9FLAO|nr:MULTISPECIES: hypothetical protein [Flavobacterium]MBB4804385.1 hypothetical protein [Flavobacterium nitrogenifigens]MBB6389219.1 hypothetical protein [Flavobacterium notoginsengisoli]